MKKIRINNFFFDEDKESGLEKISEMIGEKIGNFFLNFASVATITFLSLLFGFSVGVKKFGKGFKKGFK